MAYNSDRFNLDNWKLTLPVDRRGNTSGEALEIEDLSRFESAHFYDAPDGAMVFTAYANGATTSGSTYPRSELREMNGNALAKWKLSQGGTMSATLKVDQVPSLDGGEAGRVIVGQIHGEDEELIRLYWDKNSVYFMNDKAGSRNKEMKFTFTDSDGRSPTISMGEKFSYMIDARGDTMKVDIHADGKVYTSVSKINSVWQSDTFYFKAGIYLGVNDDSGKGLGKVSFYGLDFGHTKGSGLGGLNPANNTPQEPEQPNPSPDIAGTSNSDTITGTSVANVIHAAGGNDVVRGRDGNDTIHGQDGNDTLYGDSQNDILEGGSGSDMLNGGSGDDRLEGGTGNDTAIGGEGRDIFIVNRGDGGLVIDDFGSGDSLLLKGYTLVDLALARLIKDDDDVVLRLHDGTSVTFNDVTIEEIATARLQVSINNVITSFVPGKPAPNNPEPETPVASKNGTNGNDRLNGDDDDHDVISARGGNDTVYGEDGKDKLYGDDGNDTLHGNDDNDHLYGGNGNDTLYGEDGKDILYGDDGNDRLYGGQGDDILEGGRGQDTLYGGEGQDVFVFNEMPDIHDILADFDTEDDRLDIDALLGRNGDAFIRTVSGDSGLYVDRDGDGSARAVLVAVFEDRVSPDELDDILV